MFLSRPVQWFRSQADPILPDGTFKLKWTNVKKAADLAPLCIFFMLAIFARYVFLVVCVFAVNVCFCAHSHVAFFNTYFCPPHFSSNHKYEYEYLSIEHILIEQQKF